MLFAKFFWDSSSLSLLNWSKGGVFCMRGYPTAIIFSIIGYLLFINFILLAQKEPYFSINLRRFMKGENQRHYLETDLYKNYGMKNKTGQFHNNKAMKPEI